MVATGTPHLNRIRHPEPVPCTEASDHPAFEGPPELTVTTIWAACLDSPSTDISRYNKMALKKKPERKKAHGTSVSVGVGKGVREQLLSRSGHVGT